MVLAAVPGHPVVMGLSDNPLRAALERLRRIAQRPIAGLLVAAPYSVRASQAGVMDYFSKLAEAASTPLVIYNIPHRTGVTMELTTLRTLARQERIVALKDCGGDLALTMHLIADGQLQVLTDEDQQVLVNLCLGGSGAIAGSAQLCPELFVRLPQLLQAGRLDEARAVFYQLLPLIRLAFEEPNPGPVQAALALMGLVRDESRAPMQVASPAMRDALRCALTRLECL